MKRPTWATVIGIFALIFGIFGILGGAQDIAMPSMLEMQKNVMEGVVEAQREAPVENGAEIGVEKDAEESTPNMAKMMETMEDQFQMPDWYSDAAPVIGGVSILISAFYLLAGIFLLMTKEYAVKAIVIALGLSIAWAIVQSLIFMKTANFMLMAQMPMAIASIVIDIVFLIVVVIGSKEAFSVQPPEVQGQAGSAY